jgi:RNA polymerase sigma-70 factor (ECF subfamily)
VSSDAEDRVLRALAAAAIEGDGVALADLVRLTQRDVWRICAALGSTGETEDLVQETYLRAVKSLGGYRGDAPLRVWLLSIARRTCADHVRRRQRQRRLMERLHALAPADEQVAAPPETTVAGSLDAVVARIDPDRREAFVLTQIVGLSYEEAATVVGCPIGTIRSRVARARADLAVAVAAADAG